VLDYPARRDFLSKGGDNFDIARKGRCANLHGNSGRVLWGEEENFAQVERLFPIPFWRVSLAALSSRDPAEGPVSVGGCRGDAWVLHG
jgi:hypothetical protein